MGLSFYKWVQLPCFFYKEIALRWLEGWKKSCFDAYKMWVKHALLEYWFSNFQTWTEIFAFFRSTPVLIYWCDRAKIGAEWFINQTSTYWFISKANFVEHFWLSCIARKSHPFFKFGGFANTSCAMFYGVYTLPNHSFNEHKTTTKL